MRTGRITIAIIPCVLVISCALIYAFSTNNIRKQQILDSGDTLLCLAAEGFCPPSHENALIIANGCGKTSGKNRWRELRGGKGSGPPFFFRDLITSKAETGSPVLELGGSWEILGMNIFNSQSSNRSARILTFQPDPIEFEKLRRYFNRNIQIQMHPFGLGNETKTLKFAGGSGTASASAFQRGDLPGQGSEHTIELRDLDHVLDFAHHFSLLIINCEGCEYELLEKLMNSEKLSAAIGTVLVQFHRHYKVSDVSPEEARCKLIRLLREKGWCPIFSFPFTWEAWTNPSACMR